MSKNSYLTIAISILTVLSLAFLSGCGGSSSNNTTDGTTPGTQTDKVNISNFAFEPSTITVTAGTTVTWTNQDSVAHTVVSDTFKSGNLSQGQAFQFKFDTKGTYNYSCSIHPTMKGTVIVE